MRAEASLKFIRGISNDDEEQRLRNTFDLHRSEIEERELGFRVLKDENSLNEKTKDEDVNSVDGRNDIRINGNMTFIKLNVNDGSESDDETDQGCNNNETETEEENKCPRKRLDTVWKPTIKRYWIITELY